MNQGKEVYWVINLFKNPMVGQIKYKTLSGNFTSFGNFHHYIYTESGAWHWIGAMIILFSIVNTRVFGQKTMSETTIVALPIVYFTPETNWAFGAGASYTFHLDSMHLRPSTIQIGGVYTLRKQFLSYLSFNLYHPDRRWELTGELGYYDYVYKYWGIGNRTPESGEESYGVSFPRIRITPKYIFSEFWRIGLTADFNYYSGLHIKEGGLLDIQKTTGVSGGFVNGIGLQLQYDSREHTIFPIKGWYVAFKTIFYNPIWGSGYTFTSQDVDIRHYQNIAGGIIWASQLLASFRNGQEIPFYHLSKLGGSGMMRGYFEGRYRNHNLWALQTECRVPVWKWFFIVPFVSAGDVFDFENYRRSVKLAGGLGLRYIVDHKNRVNIRADVAYGKNFQFYLSILEAF